MRYPFCLLALALTSGVASAQYGPYVGVTIRVDPTGTSYRVYQVYPRTPPPRPAQSGPPGSSDLSAEEIKRIRDNASLPYSQQKR